MRKLRKLRDVFLSLAVLHWRAARFRLYERGILAELHR